MKVRPRHAAQVAVAVIGLGMISAGSPRLSVAEAAPGGAVACYYCMFVEDPSGNDGHCDFWNLGGNVFGFGHACISGNCLDWDFDHAPYGGAETHDLAYEAVASGTDEALIAFLLQSDGAVLNVDRSALQVVGPSGLVLYHAGLAVAQVDRVSRTIASIDPARVVETSR